MGIIRLHFEVPKFIGLVFKNGTAKTKLVIFSFLCYGEFVKNSIPGSFGVNLVIEWAEGCKNLGKCLQFYDK